MLTLHDPFGIVSFSITAFLFTVYLGRNKVSTVHGKDVVLVIDIGSSSIRCSVFSTEAMSSSSEELNAVAGGGSELESGSGAEDHVSLLFREASSFPACTPQSGWDNSCFDSEPAADLATAAAVTLSRQDFIAALIKQHHRRTGTMFYHPSYLPAQLHAFQQHGSTDTRVMPRYYQTVSSYILSQWCRCGSSNMNSINNSTDPDVGPAADIFPISYSEASWTGLLNYHEMSWDTSSLDLINCFVAHHYPPTAVGHSEKERQTKIEKSEQMLSLPMTCLPPLCDPEELSGDQYTLSAHYRQQWNNAGVEGGSESESGLSKSLFSVDTKLFLGLGDGAAANWGSGDSARFIPDACPEEGENMFGVGKQKLQQHPLVVTIGTSAAARVVVRRGHICCSSNLHAQNSDGIKPDPESVQVQLVRIPIGLFCYVLDKTHLLVGGALTDGGSLVEWCRSQLLDGDNAKLEKYMSDLLAETLPLPVLADTDISAKGNYCDNVPVMLPFWTAGAGERSPGYHSQAVGTISHINKNTTSKQLLQCAVEGVSFRLMEIVSLLRTVCCGTGVESGVNATKSFLPIVGSGGALDANPYWMKLLAILTGSAVVRTNSSEVGEATSLGVARYMWTHLLSDASKLKPTHGAATVASIDQEVVSPATSSHFAKGLSLRKAKHDQLYKLLLV